jgi:hypothetical protein
VQILALNDFITQKENYEAVTAGGLNDLVASLNKMLLMATQNISAKLSHKNQQQ